MACLIENGLPLGCSSIGGVNRVWIGTYTPDAEYTRNADGVITGVTSGSTIYLVEQDFEYAGLTEPGVITRENGTVLFETALTLKFIELNADLKNFIKAASKAPIFAVVESNAGHFYAIGTERAARATEVNQQLGVAMADMNGATLTIGYKSQNGVELINGALIDSAGLPLG